MTPETLETIAANRNILAFVDEVVSQDLQPSVDLFDKFSEPQEDQKDRKAIGDTAYRAGQMLLERMYHSMEEDVEEVEISNNKEFQQDYRLTGRVLETKQYGRIYLEKFVNYEDGTIVYNAGFFPQQEIINLPEENMPRYSFVPDVPEMRKWDQKEYFVWVVDGLETIKNIAKSVGIPTNNPE
jgi:hypothetical protein